MATGWKKKAGPEVIQNKMLLGHSMALYQAQKHLNDASLAAFLGTTVEELPELGARVIPQYPAAWAKTKNLNVGNFLLLLQYAKDFIPREQRGERRMISIRLQEAEHASIHDMAEALHVNVTAVVERAVRELAARVGTSVQ